MSNPEETDTPNLVRRGSQTQTRFYCTTLEKRDFESTIPSFSTVTHTWGLVEKARDPRHRDAAEPKGGTKMLGIVDPGELFQD